MSEARILELIEIFDEFDGHYKRQELDEALALREEITPHLIPSVKKKSLLAGGTPFPTNNSFGRMANSDDPL